MSKKNVVIHFNNLHPTEPTQEFIESVMNEIHHELPMGSNVKATFSAQDGVVKGMLRVGSYAGPFFAVAASNSIKEVTMRLLMQMRRRIEKFKAKSHKKRSIKHLSVAPDFNFDSAVATLT